MSIEQLKSNGNSPVEDLFREFEHFCKAMLDAYCIVDPSGRIVKINALFSQLVGQKSRQILKTNSLDDLLTLDINGEAINVERLLSYKSPTRIDEVRGKSGDKTDLNLIIGLYPFFDANQNHVGTFLLVRDVTAETNLQDKYKDKATQSITDPLTGLFNRKYFTEYLANQVSSMQTMPDHAGHRTMSLIMIDIDHFKKVNDVYGHQAGDYVIKTVAQLMRETFRKTDVVSRYGGEEFLAILPGTDVPGSLTAAEKLRTRVEEHEFVFDGKKMPIRVSSGVAQFRPTLESADETIARADSALYFSKENGRNRVSFHDGDKINTLLDAMSA